MVTGIESTTPALTPIAVTPVPSELWQGAIASGRGAVPNVGAVPACDPGVAFWTIDGLAIRTVERQSGSGVRRWGV
jgi:hypothetical protein